KLKATAANRGQQRVGSGGEHQQGRVGGRFLEGFEEDVGRGHVHAVGLVHDDHLVVAGGVGDGTLADEFAHGAGVVGGFTGLDLAHLAGRAEGKAVRVFVGGEARYTGIAGRVEEAIGDGVSDGVERFVFVAGDEQAVGEPAPGDSLFDDGDRG